jgi:drug/metabolite transporter (DMT)-like permease
MRIAGPPLGPIALMAIRVTIAASILLAFVGAIRQMPDFRGRWRQFLVIGAIGNAIPFVLIGNAVIHLNSPLQASVGQVCGASVLLTPLVLVAPPSGSIAWPVILSVLALAVPCTVLAYLLYFRLIAKKGGVRPASQP